jgi:hypothetical protein
MGAALDGVGPHVTHADRGAANAKATASTDTLFMTATF